MPVSDGLHHTVKAERDRLQRELTATEEKLARVTPLIEATNRFAALWIETAYSEQYLAPMLEALHELLVEHNRVAPEPALTAARRLP